MMNKLKEPKRTLKRMLLSVYHYLCFFLLMAFLISCCMILFLSTMSKTMNTVLTEENIGAAAKITFLNVVFLSLICTVTDALRRKLTVERPVNEILNAAERIAKGDYSARVTEPSGLTGNEGLGRIAACFNKMAEELSGIESMQTDFSANVSHEIKTPLAVIKNYSTLLASASISEEKRIEYARAISQSSDKLGELVGNILRLNKLENKSIYPNRKRYSLADQLCESIIGFEDIIEEKEIELTAELDDSVYVYSDPELLSIAWNNLISNAVKFTDVGGRVKISLTKDGEFAKLTVEDTGIGISPDTGAHIFDKFYQADTSHRGEGNGLGLALVKRVIDITEGEISVSSVPSKGSVFTVKIRRSEDENK